MGGVYLLVPILLLSQCKRLRDGTIVLEIYTLRQEDLKEINILVNSGMAKDTDKVPISGSIRTNMLVNSGMA